eukprot:382796-Prymnesium_polylepis.1
MATARMATDRAADTQPLQAGRPRSVTGLVNGAAASAESRGRQELASRRLHFLLSRLQMLLG